MSALNVGQIKGEGGIQAPRLSLVHRTDTVPRLKICNDAAAQSSGGQ